MHRERNRLVKIPKLKQSKTQGRIGYQFLRIINREPFRTVSEVRAEFKPIVIHDKAARADESPRLLRSFKKQISTREGEEKLFDSEYCRLRDYLSAFDFIATLGPQRNEEVTLTYFGTRLLANCIANKVEDIFGRVNKDVLAKIYCFVDGYKHWRFLKIIKEKGPISLSDFSVLLMQLEIGFDREEIEKDIVAKPSFMKWLNDEWKKTHRLAPMDYGWKKNKIDESVKEMVKIRENTYVSALLNLYADVGLIKKEKSIIRCNTQYLNELQRKKFWRTSEDIDPGTFIAETYAAYSEQIKSKGVISTPIPLLRKLVCDRLGMLWWSFDKLLGKYPMGYGGYEVTLTRASSRKKLDLEINSKHFYYISIKKVEQGLRKNV